MSDDIYTRQVYVQLLNNMTVKLDISITKQITKS